MEAYDDTINSGIEKIDLYLKGLFEGKKTISDLFLEELNILYKLRTKPIIKEELFSSFFKLIKKELVKRGGNRLKTASITLLNSKYYYKKLVDTIKKSSNESIEDKAIEIIGNLFFDIIEKNPIINKDQKILEAPKLENYLLFITK